MVCVLRDFSLIAQRFAVDTELGYGKAFRAEDVKVQHVRPAFLTDVTNRNLVLVIRIPIDLTFGVCKVFTAFQDASLSRFFNCVR